MCSALHGGDGRAVHWSGVFVDGAPVKTNDGSVRLCKKTWDRHLAPHKRRTWSAEKTASMDAELRDAVAVGAPQPDDELPDDELPDEARGLEEPLAREQPHVREEAREEPAAELEPEPEPEPEPEVSLELFSSSL